MKERARMEAMKLRPEWFLMPVAWKTKGTRIYTRISSEQCRKVLCQSVVRVDDVQPIAYDSQNEIYPRCAIGRLRNEGVMWATRHQWTHSQCAIPQSGVVCANIANVHQRVEPRSKHRIAYTKSSGHIPFGKSGLQILIEDGHCAERSDFKCYPTGWQRVGVFPSEGTYKLFVTALIFILNAGNCFCMLNLITEEGSILEPIAAISQRHHVCQLSTHGYFYTLNTGKDYSSQMTVEFVKHASLFKRAACLKNVIPLIHQEWIPIAAHPIITHLAKPIICVVFVGDYHAALFQNGDLAGKCLYLFSVWYLLHRYSKKKAYPKRAVLWEAGQACWAQKYKKFIYTKHLKKKSFNKVQFVPPVCGENETN